MKIVMSFILMLFAMAAHANTGISSESVTSAGWNNLTKEQQAAIIQEVATQSKQTAAPTKAETLSEYANIGAKIADSISTAAKGVGVAVNEFIQTPAGKLTVALIVWHFVGSAAVHLLAAVIILIVGLIVLYIIFRRIVDTKIEYSADKTDIFGRARVVKVTRSSFSSDDVAYLSAYILILFVALCITVFTGI